MVAISQWILGIRPEHEGLRVEPVIPAAWPRFSATRRFRGTTYQIEVNRLGRERPDLTATAAGPLGLVVDGRPIEGSVIPLPDPGTPLVRVEVGLP
jgi:cellobiose phosphorylase